MDSLLETNLEGGGRKRKPRGLPKQKVSGRAPGCLRCLPVRRRSWQRAGAEAVLLELRPGGLSPQG